MKGMTVYECSKLKSERGGGINREKEGGGQVQDLKVQSCRHKCEGKNSGLVYCQDYHELFSLPYN